MRKAEILETLTGLALVCVVVGFTFTQVKQRNGPTDTTPQQELAAAARSAQADKQAPPAVPSPATGQDDGLGLSAVIDQARHEVEATNRHDRQNQAAIDDL